MNTKDKQYLMGLGERIKSLRLAKQIEQRSFAHQCEISRTQLYMIESGKTNPRIMTLIKIAKGLDTSISDMLIVRSKK